jgi:hypothetical protein
MGWVFPSKPQIQSMDTPSCFAMSATTSRLGVDEPFSKRDTKLWVIPQRVASSLWVNPARVRASFRRCWNIVLTPIIKPPFRYQYIEYYYLCQDKDNNYEEKLIEYHDIRY